MRLRYAFLVALCSCGLIAYLFAPSNQSAKRAQDDSVIATRTDMGTARAVEYSEVHPTAEPSWDELYDLAVVEPAKALDAVLLRESSEQRRDLAKYAIAEWTLQDPVAAFEWTQGIEHRDLQAELIATLGAVWADQDPMGAAEIMLVSLEPSNARTDALHAIAARWIQNDREGLTAWISTIPYSEVQQSIIDMLSY